MTREDIVALFDRRDENWRRRDAGGLAADFALDAVLESPIGGTAHGRSAIREVYVRVLEAFRNLQVMEVRRIDLLIDGNRAALNFEFSGTHSGVFLGVPPTGKQFTVQGVTWTTVDDTKITHERRVYDFTGFLVKIGVLNVKLM